MVIVDVSAARHERQVREPYSLLPVALGFWGIAPLEHLLLDVYSQFQCVLCLHIAEMDDPIMGMTLDRKPTAVCKLTSCVKTLRKWLFDITFCPRCPLPAVNMRTRLCLSAYAYTEFSFSL